MEQQYKFILDYQDAVHTEEDLRLSLLAGATVKFGNLYIEPYSLEEVIKIGYTKYFKALQLVMLDINDFDEVLKKVFTLQQRAVLQETGTYSPFHLYLNFCGEEFRKYLIDGLRIIFKTDKIFAYENKSFISIYEEVDPENIDLENDLIINDENFESIIRIAKLQNYLDIDLGNVVEENGNPADEETRMLLETQRKMKAKLKRLKSKKKNGEGEEGFDFSSLVSALTTKSLHINKTNVWGMTIYQIYDEFNRLIMVDDYATNIKALLAGAKDIDIKHWSAKPDIEE